MEPTTTNSSVHMFATRQAIEAIQTILDTPRPTELTPEEQSDILKLNNFAHNLLYDRDLTPEPTPKTTRQFFAYMESSIVYQGEFKTSQRCGGIVEGFDIIELAKELRTSFAKDINTTPDKILIKSLSIF